MDNIEVVSRFNRLYLGDSLLLKVELNTGGSECKLTFNAGSVLRAEDTNTFEPEARFQPAVLTLKGLLSLSCDGLGYQLNSTVVGFRVVPSAKRLGLFEFHFELTGGTDPEAFMVSLKFEAKGFEFAGVGVER
jgi:hypothetical protein